MTQHCNFMRFYWLIILIAKQYWSSSLFHILMLLTDKTWAPGIETAYVEKKNDLLSQGWFKFCIFAFCIKFQSQLTVITIPLTLLKIITHLVFQLDKIAPKSLPQNVNSSINDWAIWKREPSRYRSLTDWAIRWRFWLFLIKSRPPCIPWYRHSGL